MENVNKFLRRKIILEIIKTKNIKKQKELLEELKKRGITITQSTISRDLKEMKVIGKTSKTENHMYSLANQKNIINRYQQIFKDTVIDISVEDNYVVINTFCGIAKTIGALIDRCEDSRIIGTLARRKCIFIICKNNSFAKKVAKELEVMLFI